MPTEAKYFRLPNKQVELGSADMMFPLFEENQY